ncbi:MAG: nitroreductase family protein [Bacilli bacterium]|nr:nitroreductase family protein [Bacilli bacterium]
MDALDAILTRKSVRKFKEAEIEEEKIDLLLKAAMAAPSGVNKQPWKFVVVKSEEAKAKVIDAMPFGKYKSPIIIIPCVRDLEVVPMMHDLAYCDLGAATENILLAAHALELGAVWCAIYPSKSRVKDIKKALNLGVGISPYSAIYIGYPAEDDKSQVKDKFKERNIEII